MIPREDFSLEYLELLSIDVVLVFPPRRSTLFVLQSPVDGEKWRENLELKSRNEHFIHLGVSSVAVANKPLVVWRIVVGRNEERLVEKLGVKF